jgi:type IV secretory pathway VirB2 component (pilin)
MTTLNGMLDSPRADRVVLALCYSMIFMSPSVAHAASGADLNTMATAILTMLTGPLAKTLATIAVVVCGFMYFTGRGSMQTLVTVIVGCFIVFSASWIVGLISGGS